jgi:hypothetical protein
MVCLRKPIRVLLTLQLPSDLGRERRPTSVFSDQ